MKNLNNFSDTELLTELMFRTFKEHAPTMDEEELRNKATEAANDYMDAVYEMLKYNAAEEYLD